MKTDDLISMLSTNVEPVDHRHMARNISTAVVVGAAAVVALVVFVLGPRDGLTIPGTIIPAFLKAAVTVVVLVPASVYLIRLARPGGERSAGRGACRDAGHHGVGANRVPVPPAAHRPGDGVQAR